MTFEDAEGVFPQDPGSSSRSKEAPPKELQCLQPEAFARRIKKKNTGGGGPKLPKEFSKGTRGERIHL